MNNWLYELWRGLSALVRRNQIDADLEEEMRLHVELRAGQHAESGAAADEAYYAAQRRFGNVLQLKETSRDVWGWASLERLWQDLRYGFRILRRSPIFTAAAVITLSLGIGANTAMFSIIDTVLLRPLPYAHPERLVRVWQGEPKMGAGRLGTAPPEFVSYRDRTRAFASVAGYQSASYDLTGDRAPEHTPACEASASLFATLGIQPLIGRVFTANDESPGAPKVVVLSYNFWSNHYAKDPSVLGTVVRLDEQPHQIIGGDAERLHFSVRRREPGRTACLVDSPILHTRSVA